MTKFYNIRVIKANNRLHAIKKIERGEFIDNDKMSDVIVKENQLKISEPAKTNEKIFTFRTDYKIYAKNQREAKRILATDDNVRDEFIFDAEIIKVENI
jgi:hypothetical protein